MLTKPPSRPSGISFFRKMIVRSMGRKPRGKNQRLWRMVVMVSRKKPPATCVDMESMKESWK